MISRCCPEIIEMGGGGHFFLAWGLTSEGTQHSVFGVGIWADISQEHCMFLK